MESFNLKKFNVRKKENTLKERKREREKKEERREEKMGKLHKSNEKKIPV